MAIDDVDYLKENSDVHNNVLIVDSHTRDFYSHPTPSHYCVDLIEPMQNVIGFEILDASIPRTMYVVDFHNDLLVIHQGPNVMTVDQEDGLTYLTSDVSSNTIEVYIPHNDYVMTELIDELNLLLGPYDIEVNAESPDRVDKHSKLIFQSNVSPFVIDLKLSTCADIIGFNHPSVNYVQRPVKVSPNRGETYPRHVPVHYDEIRVEGFTRTRWYTDGSGAIETDQAVFPNKNVWLYGSLSADTPTIEVVSTSRFPLSASTLATNFVSVPLTSPVAIRWNTGNTSGNDTYTVTDMVLPVKLNTGAVASDIIPGNISIRFTDISNNSQVAFVKTDAPYTSPLLNGTISVKGYSDLTDEQKVAMAPSDPGSEVAFISIALNDVLYVSDDISYWIELSDSSPTSSFGLLMGDSGEFSSTVLSRVTNFVFVYDSSNNAWTVVRPSAAGGVETLAVAADGSALFDADGEEVIPTSTLGVAVTTSKSTHSIYSPGIVSLVGPRYILLRCDEIEKHTQDMHLFTNVAQGLAMFKLGVYGFTDQRYDFSSIKYKDFHPIAKLQKLTFRFTLPDGRLYDFKGVDHHMLVSIKTLVPTIKKPDLTHALNPHYTPDVVAYLTRKRLEDLETGFDISSPNEKETKTNIEVDSDSDSDSESEYDTDVDDPESSESENESDRVKYFN